MLQLTEIQRIVDGVRFQNWEFHVGSFSDTAFYVQVRFGAVDNVTHELHQVQSGQQWHLSPHMTEPEIVQRCLKAVLTALEHEAREQFTYHGKALFQPHMDINVLAAHCDTKVRRAA